MERQYAVEFYALNAASVFAYMVGILFAAASLHTPFNRSTVLVCETCPGNCSSWSFEPPT